MKIKIAIVDDCEKIRRMTAALLNLEHDFVVVLQAENGKIFLEQLETTMPDLVLLDIRMPEMCGLKTSVRLKELYPNLKIIAYSQYDFESNIIEMNIRGVKSFIGKNDEPEELFKEIRTVFTGGAYMTDRSTTIIQKYLAYKHNIVCPINVDDTELSLIKKLCQGLSSKEIGDIICKSPRTVEKYRDDLYRKFQVSSKEELIATVVKFGLV